ncbi:MAG TPA: transglycosylase SLT domain-containing protein [Chloroflexota bacterium]|nr:transglycosylase SLT domain-containing protein [Chloroflexota bacterium]
MLGALSRTILIGIALAGVVALPAWSIVHADTAVPTPTVAAPTVAPPTPSPTATALAPPTVVEERSTPTVETLPPTVAPATATPATESTRVRPPISRSIGTPTLQVPATPVEIPWPSPDQLRADARLRWGKGIPASVRRWAFLIVPAARRYHVDPNLVAAVMTMESNGDPLALSPADARGLMQILHGPWDPATNVRIGVRMLAELYARFGDWTLALAAYNAGPGAVAAAGGIPAFRETRDYVIIVTYLWDLFGHRHLTSERRLLYAESLNDLRRFADQRKKVSRLAVTAHVLPSAIKGCSAGACDAPRWDPAPASPDPFWPLGGSPDPLQHIDPYSAVG